MNTRSRIAQALASPALTRAPSEYDSQGLQSPTGQRILENLGIVAGGYGAGNLGGNLAVALAKKGLPMAEALGETGAIFPEGTPPAKLPVIPGGAKTGDPHALFAYEDMFGPGMTKREIYNIFGDPAHPAIQKAGWGSSLSLEDLKKFGIPITGREAGRAFK